MITEAVHVVRSSDGETTRVVRIADGVSAADLTASLAAERAYNAGTYLSQSGAPGQITDRTTAIGGAVSTASSRAAAVINIVERGAKADSGVTDNRAIIQQAILDCYNLGGGTVIIPPAANDTAFYGVSGIIVVYSKVHVVLQGHRAHVKGTRTSGSYSLNCIFMMGNYGGDGTTLDAKKEIGYYFASDPVAGAQAVTLATGGGAHFVAGDIVGLTSQAVNSINSPLASQINEVVSITGDVLTLRYMLPDSYPTATIAVTITAADDTLTFTAPHWRVAGDTITLATLTGGAGLATATTYYVKTVADATHMTVSATLGGAAIDITTDGTGTSALPSKIYRINTDPFDTSGSVLGLDGNRGFMARGASITGGGKISVSAWAQTQEAAGACVTLACYESEWDFTGVGGTILSGNMVAYSTGKSAGRYRYAAMEFGYWSCNNEVWVSGQRYGASRATVTRCFGAYLNAEGVCDNLLHIGTISHYDNISTYAPVTDNGVRNRITGGVVNGYSGGASADGYAAVLMGVNAIDSTIENTIVPAPFGTGFRAASQATRGEFRNCRVLKASSSLPAFDVESPCTAIFQDCISGDPLNLQPMDIITDANIPPNRHRNNRVRTAIQPYHKTVLPGVTTGVTTSVTSVSYALVANSLAESGVLKVTAYGSVTDVAGGTKTITLQFSSTTLATLVLAAGETGFWHIEVTIFQRITSGSTKQGYFGTTRKNTTISGVPQNAVVSVGGSPTTIDTITTLQPISLKFQLSNASDSLRREYFAVEPAFDQVAGPAA